VWLLPAAALARRSAVRVAAVALTLVLLWGFTPHGSVVVHPSKRGGTEARARAST
jgi:hypothetical protein